MTPRRKPTNGGPLRVAGYVRVSTQEQGQHGISLAAQRERIESFAQSRGWELVRTYSDTASGKDTKRPGLQKMLEDAKRQQFEGVVILKIDRLSRRVMDFGALQETLEGAGVDLISVSETFDTTTPIGRAMSNIVAVFAQMEREVISERTRMALQHKKAHLQPYSRLAPYGFRRRQDRLLPDPKALAVVRDIFATRKAGKTLRDIASTLTERHISSPQGRPEWSPETVRLILRNAALYGQVMNGLLEGK
jgi:site-specific DNA recombinase